jgi:hypothetical protein
VSLQWLMCSTLSELFTLSIADKYCAPSAPKRLPFKFKSVSDAHGCVALGNECEKGEAEEPNDDVEEEEQEEEEADEEEEDAEEDVAVGEDAAAEETAAMPPPAPEDDIKPPATRAGGAPALSAAVEAIAAAEEAAAEAGGGGMSRCCVLSGMSPLHKALIPVLGIGMCIHVLVLLLLQAFHDRSVVRRCRCAAAKPRVRGCAFTLRACARACHACVRACMRMPFVPRAPISLLESTSVRSVLVSRSASPTSAAPSTPRLQQQDACKQEELDG